MKEEKTVGANADTRMILDALVSLTTTLQATQKLESSHYVPPSKIHSKKETSFMERVLAFVAPIAMILGVYMTMHDDILIQKRDYISLEKELLRFSETKKEHQKACKKLELDLRALEDDVNSLLTTQSRLYRMIKEKE